MWRERQPVRWERTVGKAGGLALHVCEGLRVASVPAQGNSLGLPIAHNNWIYAPFPFVNG